MAKLILSRKGFDSASGGGPSPILPDGRLISLPIPGPGLHRYAHLAVEPGLNYADLMVELGYHRVWSAAWIPLEDASAHLDPDLAAHVVHREIGWRPMLGQAAAAQGHLVMQGVGPGDVFLCFGLFQHTERHAGLLRFAGPKVHVLWSYLEVEEVDDRKVANPREPELWRAQHPHYARGDDAAFRARNTVYISAERCSLDTSRPGAGTFGTFADALQLSRAGSSASNWRLPQAMHPKSTRRPLSYHNDPARWSLDSPWAYLRSVGRGQEFVVERTPPIDAWITELIAGCGGAAK